jgi:YD repeat-containing protein
MVDATGTTTWTMNEADQSTTLAQPNGTTSYVYRADGQRDTMTETSVGTTTYTYDSYGRPSTLTNPASQATAWTYDSYGRVNKQTFAPGQYEEYGYDATGRQNEVTVKTSGNAVVEWQKMEYDTEGNMSWRRHGTSSSSYLQTNYTYDKINQIPTETRGTSGTSDYFYGSYSYDANGNRTLKVTQTGTGSTVTTNSTYDAGDKMKTFGSFTLAYDGAGRPTQYPMKNTSGSYALTYLNWDYEGRMTQVASTLTPYPNVIFQNAYNGLDTRTRVDSSYSGAGSPRIFRRDGAGVTAPVLTVTANYGSTVTNVTPGISQKLGSTTTYQHAGIKNNDAQSQSASSVSAAGVGITRMQPD